MTPESFAENLAERGKKVSAQRSTKLAEFAHANSQKERIDITHDLLFLLNSDQELKDTAFQYADDLYTEAFEEDKERSFLTSQLSKIREKDPKALSYLLERAGKIGLTDVQNKIVEETLRRSTEQLPDTNKK